MGRRHHPCGRNVFGAHVRIVFSSCVLMSDRDYTIIFARNTGWSSGFVASKRQRSGQKREFGSPHSSPLYFVSCALFPTSTCLRTLVPFASVCVIMDAELTEWRRSEFSILCFDENSLAQPRESRIGTAFFQDCTLQSRSPDSNNNERKGEVPQPHCIGGSNENPLT